MERPRRSRYFLACAFSSKIRQIEKHVSICDEEDAGFLRKKKINFLGPGFAEGSTMTFHHISYRVHLKTGHYGFRKVVKKDILTDVSGVMKPGLNAILGPTGCGKSSLLDILATRKNPKGLTGDILINGFPLPPNFKCISGYVVQDDIVMGTLTVRENLEFSAALRLPLSMSKKEKQERVETVLKELDLSKVADSKIGTHFIRGVSGGERKRTSIGLELITHPTVLFLDEPTTGLDASTANAVLLLLKKMAVQGRTIIFSIHQPRYSIYKLFDSLTLLAAGRLLYHGPCENALPYFKGLGYMCEPYNNPADFFLDIINEDSTAVGMSKMTIITIPIDEDNDMEDTDSIALGLAIRFTRSAYYKQMMADLDALSSDDKKKTTAYKGIPYTTPFLHQLKWVSKRTFKNLIGNPQNSTAQICIATFLGLIVGSVFAGVKNDATGIQNRVGALFFLTTNQCLNSITTVELFITEKRIFIHEYISGYYRVSAYFFSKILADMVPMRTLPGIILTSLNYFLIGFKPTVVAFFTMMITVILVAYAASSMSLAIATGQNVTSVANLIINICFVFMIVFSGLLVNITTISPWLLWLKYFSIPRYGLNALQVNEFTGLKFCSELEQGVNVTCIAPSPFTICTGEEYLKMQGIDMTFLGMVKNYVALICMTIIFLSIAYLKLRFIKKYT
ncbi:broad substrate specificity ATP-binding cassette transporter ABCG2-like isoform X1 [Podarcis raffonei]|uniref:broad substrate specificity ATP-binding cassette transporter ABCG2-like isoform X1 n=2 Tax=Podarcis raffonei TaxID=65483 RepID=UPI00232927E8|nr:broad substrate specificity ATP-binding cassette transporter ABCG2-like isoform X1 [Podarcis raffonei]